MKPTTILIAAVWLTGFAGCNSLPPGPVRSVATRPSPVLPRRGEAYLLRGWHGLWSDGVDRLGLELRAAGVDAQVFRAEQSGDLAGALARRFGKPGPRPPLVLIGFSYGADDAVKVATRLGQAGISVDLLVTIDPVAPPPVPHSVKLCRNYYQSNGSLDVFPWLRGVPLKAVEKPAPTSPPVNLDIRTRADLREARTSHATIAANPKLHKAILDEVRRVCPARWDSSHWAAQFRAFKQFLRNRAAKGIERYKRLLRKLASRLSRGPAHR